MPVTLIEGEETSTSSTVWTTVVEAKIPDTISKILIWLKEQDVNNLIYRVQCSVEPTFAAGYNQTLVDRNHNSSFHLDKNTSGRQSLADPYPYVRVQIKSSVAKTHGTALCHILGSSASGGGSLDVDLAHSSMPYLYAIAKGNEEGHLAVRRFGHNADIGTAWETLYHESDLYVYLTSAERLQVVSTDVNDDGDPANTGARTMYLQGLNADYELINETVTLNGQTNVLTDNSYLRVFKAYIVTAGTSETNEGNITISNNADDNVLLGIPAGEGETHAAIFTVPAGQTIYLVKFWGTELTNKGVHFVLMMKPFGGAWRQKVEKLVNQCPFDHQFNLPVSFPEKTDLEIRVMGAAVAGEATGGFGGWREW